VAVAIAGVAIVIVGSAGAPEWNPAGDAIAVCAVLSYTAYFLISKQARTTVATLEYMTIVHLAAALMVTPIALASPGELVSFDAVDLLIVLFFALVSGTAGQVVIGWAHRYVDISMSSLIMLGVPAVAAITAWPLLGETLGPVQIAGGLISLAAIGAMLRRPAATTTPEPLPASGLVTE
jgi:drug/metabolite transporter (DMT)-like permease